MSKLVFRKTALLVVGVLLLAVTNCGGGKFKLIVTDQVNKPISLSNAVYDKEGKIISTPGQLKIVHHFNHSLTHYALFWSLVNLSDAEHDLSSLLASELAAHQGDAIINLQARLENFNFCLNYPAAVIPIVPSTVITYVEGDVVRIKEQKD